MRAAERKKERREKERKRKEKKSMIIVVPSCLQRRRWRTHTLGPKVEAKRKIDEANYRIGRAKGYKSKDSIILVIVVVVAASSNS